MRIINSVSWKCLFCVLQYISALWAETKSNENKENRWEISTKYTRTKIFKVNLKVYVQRVFSIVDMWFGWLFILSERSNVHTITIVCIFIFSSLSHKHWRRSKRSAIYTEFSSLDYVPFIRTISQHSRNDNIWIEFNLVNTSKIRHVFFER